MEAGKRQRVKLDRFDPNVAMEEEVVGQEVGIVDWDFYANPESFKVKFHFYYESSVFVCECVKLFNKK